MGRLDTRGFAMLDPPALVLEKQFQFVDDQAEITILAELVIRCPGYHVCRSAVYQQTFVTDIALETGRTTFSILKGVLTKGGRLPMISTAPHTQVIQHSGVDVSEFSQVIEVCSGLGAVTTGYPFCGSEVCCYVDYNPKFAEWLDRKVVAPVIHGDVSDLCTVAAVAKVTGGIPTPLNGGIACQPFSSLGDRKEQHDPRSGSLPGMLQMGFLLRAPIITLECTKEAMESHWVQSILKSFAAQTG